MERLLKDAEAWNREQGKIVDYSIDNLADVYTAIGDIQEKLEIAGTTAKEAATTISGSAATMKAAWQNVLTAISGGGDLDRAINNLVDSISNYFKNIVPVIEKALSGIGTLIAKIAPRLVQTVAKSLISAIPSLLNAVYEMIIGLSKGIYEGIVSLFYGKTSEYIENQKEAIDESIKSQKEFNSAIKETEKAQKGVLAGFDDLQIISDSTSEDEIANIFPQSNGDVLNFEEELQEVSKVEDKLKNISKNSQSIFSPIGDALSNLFESFASVATWAWKEVLTPFGNWIVDEFAPAFSGVLAESIDVAAVSFEELGGTFTSFWDETLSPIVEDIGNIITSIMNKIEVFISYFKSKLSEYKDEIALVVEFIGGVLELVWSLIKPLIDIFVSLFSNSLKNVTDGIFSLISVFANFYNYIKNIVMAIVSVFKGNFDEAGEYFKEGLKSFANVFVGIANFVISVINELWTLIFNAFKGGVNAVGGVIETIGGWFGADWDLHWNATAPLIPEIPYLAKGAVIPPNKEFLAVLGDQKSGTNIEAPLSTIEEAVENVLNRRGNQETVKEEIYNLNETELMRIIYKLSKSGERLNGSSLVEV